MFTWGEGSTGALGNGKMIDSIKPIRIDFEEHPGFIVKIRFIAAGTSHAAAITETGRIYTWGLGTYG